MNILHMFFAKGLSELMWSFDLARRVFWLVMANGVKGFTSMVFYFSSDL